MIGFFIPIAEALLVGYLTAVSFYMVLLFLLTRLGQGVLMQQNQVRWTYTALHAAIWTVASLAGAFLCCSLSPLGPYGDLGFPLCLACVLAFVLLRGFLQLRGQMSAFALLLNLAGIFGGTFLALYVRHIFTIIRDA